MSKSIRVFAASIGILVGVRCNSVDCHLLFHIHRMRSLCTKAMQGQSAIRSIRWNGTYTGPGFGLFECFEKAPNHWLENRLNSKI